MPAPLSLLPTMVPGPTRHIGEEAFQVLDRVGTREYLNNSTVTTGISTAPSIIRQMHITCNNSSHVNRTQMQKR